MTDVVMRDAARIDGDRVTPMVLPGHMVHYADEFWLVTNVAVIGSEIWLTVDGMDTTIIYAVDVQVPLAKPHPADGLRSRYGEWFGCAQCYRNREYGMGPAHVASFGCQSGGNPHCTCDSCF